MNRPSAHRRGGAQRDSLSAMRPAIICTFILSSTLACLEYFQRMQSRDRKTGNSPTFYDAKNKIDC